MSSTPRLDVDQRLEAAFRAQYPTICKYLRSRLADKSRADDLAVETFTTYRAKLADGVFVHDVEAFLIEIAKGHLQNEIKRLARANEFEELVSPEMMGRREADAISRGYVGFSPLTIEDVEFQVDHDRAVRALPPAMRDSYILAELRGLSTREAAEVLGDRDHSTVVRQVNAAKSRIRTALS